MRSRIFRPRRSSRSEGTILEMGTGPLWQLLLSATKASRRVRTRPCANCRHGLKAPRTGRTLARLSFDPLRQGTAWGVPSTSFKRRANRVMDCQLVEEPEGCLEGYSLHLLLRPWGRRTLRQSSTQLKELSAITLALTHDQSLFRSTLRNELLQASAEAHDSHYRVLQQRLTGRRTATPPWMLPELARSSSQDSGHRRLYCRDLRSGNRIRRIRVDGPRRRYLHAFVEQDAHRCEVRGFHGLRDGLVTWAEVFPRVRQATNEDIRPTSKRS